MTSIDPAFRSRIHLALKYPELNKEVRGNIWEIFLRRTSGYKEEDWPNHIIDELSVFKLNGRQIKNTVRTALVLALSEGRSLKLNDVKIVLKMVMEFERDASESTQTLMVTSPIAQGDASCSPMESLGIATD